MWRLSELPRPSGLLRQWASPFIYRTAPNALWTPLSVEFLQWSTILQISSRLLLTTDDSIPNFVWTSSVSELLRQWDFYSNQTLSKFLQWSTTFWVPFELLRESDSSRTPMVEGSQMNFDNGRAPPVRSLFWISTVSGLLWTSTANDLLRISTVSEFHPSLYCKWISSKLLLQADFSRASS